MKRDEQSSDTGISMYRGSDGGEGNWVIGERALDKLRMDSSGRKIQLVQAYRHGYIARLRKAEGLLWLEPHYPPDDADLALAWLEGWGDKDADLTDGKIDR